jgi:OOP family OmpA-OmpF porin
MKKGILLLLILAFTVGINAQTIDKKWGLGGGLGVYSPTNQGGIGVMPELYLSRFLSPKFDLMLKGGLGVLNSKQDGGIDLAGT